MLMTMEPNEEKLCQLTSKPDCLIDKWVGNTAQREVSVKEVKTPSVNEQFNTIDEADLTYFNQDVTTI